MQTALPPISGPVFEMTPDLMDRGLKASRESPRKRMILPIHRKQEALVQRMLNFLQPETYVQPHAHQREFASETMFLMQGRLAFFTFDENGEIQSVHEMTHGSLIDIEPGIWHAMVCLDPDTVILEIKRGPFDAFADKVFADWAPSENDAEKAAPYREMLETAFYDSTLLSR